MAVRRSMLLVAALSGWMLIAACGSDDDGAKATPTVASTATPTATPTVPSTATVTVTATPTATPSPDAAAACVASGGTVSTRPCCASRSDFPNTCGFGACGCSPSDSRTLSVCTCGEGQCFNGNACVVR